MQVNVTKTNKPKRIVGSMKPNEAFKIGGYWYIPISMDDESIGRDYQTFWEMHAETIPGYHEPCKMESAIACFRVSSSSFVYLDPDLEVEDYGTPSLSVTLF